MDIAGMCDLNRQIHEAVPEMPLIATGFSWLRQFFPPVAAAMVKQGWAVLACFWAILYWMYRRKIFLRI